MILLDTDVCVELLKGNKRILQRRDACEDSVGVSFMTVAELYFGAEKSLDPAKNQEVIEKLLLTVEVVHTNLSILKRFGQIKAELQKQGVPLADADILIGSAAIETSEKLITGNTKHFDRIAGLTLEDWTQPSES